MTKATEKDFRLSRQIYRLRILGLVVGCVAVGAVLHERHAGPLPWTVLALNVLLWPHIAWALARRSPAPHRLERVTLTIDSAIGGFWVAMMHFNLLPVCSSSR